MVNLSINGLSVQVEEGMTIYQAAKKVGINIPILCYHPDLSTFGACRVCTVEVNCQFVTACNTPVEEGMVINTDTDEVRKIRLINVELIMAHHNENCQTCAKKALAPGNIVEEVVICTLCGVNCHIPPNRTGACKRYVNEMGLLHRNRPLHVPILDPLDIKKQALQNPLITGVGAGTSYPDYKPGPYIVRDFIEGVDVVTAVTEAHISYSSMQVKIDTNHHIGEEGAKVKRKGKNIGMVTTEQYGSHMLILGGVNTVKGKHGLLAVRTMVEMGNREPVTLEIEGGSTLELQVGRVPIIDGKEDTKMRVGCGGATIGLFASQFKKVVDEVIVLDHHIIGLYSEHPAGAELSPYSGVVPVGSKSTPGRYFGQHGKGWGGTDIETPREAIKEIKKEHAWPGMKILVAETTWRKVALFILNNKYEPEEVSLTPDIAAMVELLAGNCENSRVSALYYAGVGGSARAGVTVNPIELTRAVHRREAYLTIGGAPAFVFPGGGITFLADVEEMAPKPFAMIPTPAIIAPVEYTIEYGKYKEIGGHVKAIRQLGELLKNENICRIKKGELIED
jgi:6-hydroxynicotinate reductase